MAIASAPVNNGMSVDVAAMHRDIDCRAVQVCSVPSDLRVPDSVVR